MGTKMVLLPVKDGGRFSPSALGLIMGSSVWCTRCILVQNQLQQWAVKFPTAAYSKFGSISYVSPTKWITKYENVLFRFNSLGFFALYEFDEHGSDFSRRVMNSCV